MQPSSRASLITMLSPRARRMTGRSSPGFPLAHIIDRSNDRSRTVTPIPLTTTSASYQHWDSSLLATAASSASLSALTLDRFGSIATPLPSMSVFLEPASGARFSRDPTHAPHPHIRLIPRLNSTTPTTSSVLPPADSNSGNSTEGEPDPVTNTSQGDGTKGLAIGAAVSVAGLACITLFLGGVWSCKRRGTMFGWRTDQNNETIPSTSLTSPLHMTRRTRARLRPHSTECISRDGRRTVSVPHEKVFRVRQPDPRRVESAVGPSTANLWAAAYGFEQFIEVYHERSADMLRAQQALPESGPSCGGATEGTAAGRDDSRRIRREIDAGSVYVPEVCESYSHSEHGDSALSTLALLPPAYDELPARSRAL
ncbi:hypothetical protein C8Q70DRAFT_947198 [Cubamyces menziesii]|nr:hypothetical protein C8Q70DRAFT_947198 [Cubamyces menziesii]